MLMNGEERGRSGCEGAASSSYIFGLIVISVGVLLLLSNFGILRFREVWRFWPALFIGVGVAKLFDAQATVGRVWALILMTFGSVALASNLGYLDVNVFALWPLLLILVGASMLLRARPVRSEDGTEPLGIDAPLNEWVVFGGVDRQVNSSNFRGGEVLAVFGGYKIDLRKAMIGKGPVVLAANAMFGGVELKVPESWNVALQGTGVFGGYEDKTYHPQMEGSAPRPELIVRGYAVFGGVEVKN
jgi:predicted membrane protein